MTPYIKRFTGIGLFVALAMNPNALIAEQGFFLQEALQDNRARVRTEHVLPQRTWDQACRSALLEPFRSAKIIELESRAGGKLEGYGAFVSASINGYHSHRDGGWLYCAATGIDIDETSSLAGTALREAWQGREHYSREILVQLLQVALRHPETYDDAIVLIALTTDENQQLQFLMDNLDPEKLTLPVAFESVFQIWLKHDHFTPLIRFEHACKSIKCRQMISEARYLKEKDDAEKVYDLSSYF